MAAGFRSPMVPAAIPPLGYQPPRQWNRNHRQSFTIQLVSHCSVLPFPAGGTTSFLSSPAPHSPLSHVSDQKQQSVDQGWRDPASYGWIQRQWRHKRGAHLLVVAELTVATPRPHTHTSTRFRQCGTTNKIITLPFAGTSWAKFSRYLPSLALSPTLSPKEPVLGATSVGGNQCITDSWHHIARTTTSATAAAGQGMIRGCHKSLRCV